MRYNAGHRLFSDIRISESITTTKKNQSILSDDIIDKNKEVVAAITFKTNKDCEVLFIWSHDWKNKEKQYPKKIKANQVYVFEDIDYISDVIFKGEIGTIFSNVAIGV